MQTCFFPADGRTCFYQWDMNREMIVTDAAIKELHYCNGTSDCSLVCAVVDGRACVPNILLQTAGNISIYGYTGDHTEIKKVFQVLPRTKPEDYVYTETEVKRYDTLEQEIAQAQEEIVAVKERVYQDGMPYSEYETVIALDTYECTLNENGAMQIAVPLAVDYDIELYNAHWPFAIGTKLNVVFDGAEYETVCQFGPPGLFAGNAAGFGGTDTGEPFAIVFYCLEQGQGTGMYGLVSYPVAPTDHTITIIARVETAVNAMDKKYMPGDMTEIYLTATNGVKYQVTVTTSGTLAVTKVT